MPSRKTGHVSYKHDLSPTLTVFRILPAPDSRFPTYQAGQYIALGRDDVPLTKKVGVDPSGKAIFGPDVDERGRRRLGTVMHAYSIASAPWETDTHGYLEFYVAQETAGGVPGRLSTVLLGMPCDTDEPVNYVDRIVGHFTLDKLLGPATRVLMIGTGTGLAPFVSMVKQLDHTARSGQGDRIADRITRSYTLLHTNRTHAELGYHEVLLDIETAAQFDFAYLPTVSRPSIRDVDDLEVGVGRATNVLRSLYELPMKEEEDLSLTAAGSRARVAAEAALARTPRPVLPDKLPLGTLRERLAPGNTVILACGNPFSTTDVQHTAGRVGIPVHVEAW